MSEKMLTLKYSCNFVLDVSYTNSFEPIVIIVIFCYFYNDKKPDFNVNYLLRITVRPDIRVLFVRPSVRCFNNSTNRAIRRKENH